MKKIKSTLPKKIDNEEVILEMPVKDKQFEDIKEAVQLKHPNAAILYRPRLNEPELYLGEFDRFYRGGMLLRQMGYSTLYTPEEYAKLHAKNVYLDDYLSPISISIVKRKKVYEANWFEASLHEIGDSEQEALDGLKKIIADTFRALLRKNEKFLSAKQRIQLATLKTYIAVNKQENKV